MGIRSAADVQASWNTGYFDLSLRRFAAAATRARSSSVTTGMPLEGRGITRPFRPSTKGRLAIFAIFTFIEYLRRQFETIEMSAPRPFPEATRGRASGTFDGMLTQAPDSIQL